MRIVHTPNNVASFPSITSQALNRKKGVTSRVILFGEESKYHHKSDSVVYLHFRKYKLYSPLFWLHLIKGLVYFFREIYRADIVHYYWSAAMRYDIDLRFIRLLKKPIVIEWLGSDIRTPAQMFVLNDFYRLMYEHPGFEYRGLEDAGRSAANQAKFRKAGAVPVVCPELSLYLNKSLFPHYFITYQRLNLADIVPVYPGTNQRPVIVHSPTAPIAKGSEYIIAALEQLSRELDFEFRLITGVSREEANRHMQECDIFIDQLMYGAYGMAATEAMAMGKPVFCYLMPELVKILPSDTPIVNVNIDTITSVLRQYLENAALRTETGRRSRAFAEKYHDADKLADDLLEYYQEIIKKRRND